MFHKAQQKQETPENGQSKSEGQKEMSSQDNTQESKSSNTVDIPQAGNSGNANYAPRPAQGLPGQFPTAGNAQTSTPSTPTPSAGISNGRRLVIGSGITMSGEIEACDHLIVEGTVEAALKGANVLDIAETGAFHGKVEIQEATVAGNFDGDITVKGRLTVKSTGTIKGNVSYEELAVEAGATLQGTLKPYKASASSTNAEEEKSESASKKEAAKTSSKKEAANSSSELPFADKQAAAAE